VDLTNLREQNRCAVRYDGKSHPCLRSGGAKELQLEAEQMTTKLPVQLLDPTASTAGQVPVSTGPATVPNWASVTAALGSAVIPVVNGGTGSATAGGQAVDNISGFTGTGFIYRNSAASYVTITPPIIQGVGGTGLSNLAAHQLVVGGSGNAMTALPVGSAGQVLVSGGASADPSYTSTLSGYLLNQPVITGVTDGSNAAAGKYGEYVTGTASAVPLITGTAANITSISLTAGDWDISGGVTFINAATTVAQAITASINTTSATVDFTTGAYFQLNTTFPAAAVNSAPAPVVRKSFTTTTTVFLVGAANFTTSTLTVNGFIRARRVR
jgi:hypothetical protein